VALSTKSTTTKKGLGRQAIQLKVDDPDLRGLLRSFNRMDDIAREDMRRVAADITEKVVNEVTREAGTSGQVNVNRAVLKSLKINKRDKAPNFTIGGSPRVTSTGARAGELIAGVEFGASKYKQFPPHRGQQGYFIFPTLKRMQRDITRDWLNSYKIIRDAWVGRIG
jgi:hypothetical protein